MLFGHEIPAAIARGNPIERDEGHNRKHCRVSHYRFLFMFAKGWFVTWPQVVAGQSQGGIYVGVSVLSPLSKGLFNRAIIESSALL